MAESLQTQLDRVQTLIGKIEENGLQGYSVGGATYTKADLEALYRREERLLRRLGRSRDNGMRVAEVGE